MTQQATAKTAEERGILLFLSLHGPARPGDFEDTFCGEPDLYSQIISPLLSWRLSPYIGALSSLIERGAVKWWRNHDGIVWYEIA